MELLLADHGTGLQLGELVVLEVQMETEVSSGACRTLQYAESKSDSAGFII